MIHNVYLGINGGLIIVASTNYDAHLRVTRDKSLIYEHPLSPNTEPEICLVDAPTTGQPFEIDITSKHHSIDHLTVPSNPLFFSIPPTSHAWK